MAPTRRFVVAASLVAATSLSSCALWHAAFGVPDDVLVDIASDIVGVFAATQDYVDSGSNYENGEFEYWAVDEPGDVSFLLDDSGGYSWWEFRTYTPAGRDYRLTGSLNADPEGTGILDGTVEWTGSGVYVEDIETGHVWIVAVHLTLTGTMTAGRMVDGVLSGAVNDQDVADWGLSSKATEDFNTVLDIRDAAIAAAP